MSLLDRLVKEKTVVWPPPVSDGLGGYSWGLPVQVLGRWQHSSGSTGPTLRYLENGSVIASRTVVWVSKDVELGSYLWEGDLNMLPPKYDVYRLAAKVVSLSTIRAVSDTFHLYKVFLDES